MSPIAINPSFSKLLRVRSWEESRVSYWVTKNEKLIRKTLTLPAAEQKKEIEEAGETPIFSYNQTDFIKERVAIEVQFGKYSFVAYDLFVKHLAFYVGDRIDVGIEILPMKSLQSQMSSGVAYYEGELYNVVRQGRGVPAVPLVIVGIGAIGKNQRTCQSRPSGLLLCTSPQATDPPPFLDELLLITLTTELNELNSGGDNHHILKV